MIKGIEGITEEVRIAHAEHRSLPAIAALLADGKVTGLDSSPDVERSAALMDLLMSARDAAAGMTGVTVPGPGRESS